MFPDQVPLFGIIVSIIKSKNKFLVGLGLIHVITTPLQYKKCTIIGKFGFVLDANE